MYDFTGCECSICHHHFKLEEDDIVVCPDCGTPYHRECYATLGHCKYKSAHAQNYEWKPPQMQKAPTETICKNCGEKNVKENVYCKDCGMPLDHEAQSTTADNNAEQKTSVENVKKAYTKQMEQTPYDYEGKPTEAQRGPVSPFTSLNGFAYVPRMDANEKIDDIPIAEWSSYIGVASPVYLLSFKQMKVTGRKFGLSLSALIFGPFYFFYRKVWGAAILFSILTILLNVPTFLTILIQTESVYAPMISDETLLLLSRISVGLGWGLVMIQSLYAGYLYKKSAAKKIQKIQSLHKDPIQRMMALRLHGGTSFGAVFLAILGFIVLSYVFSLFWGPNINAFLNLI